MNSVAVTLYSRVTMNVDIVILNCQKCNQCLKGHRSLGLLFWGVHNGHKSLGCSQTGMVIVNVYFGQITSPHHSDQMSQRSKVSRIAL